MEYKFFLIVALSSIIRNATCFSTKSIASFISSSSSSSSRSISSRSSSSSSNSRSVSSSKTKITKLWSTNNNNEKTYEEKAGIAGYSIQRQPLSWDTENDPYFKPPQDMEDGKTNSKLQMSTLLNDNSNSNNKNRGTSRPASNNRNNLFGDMNNSNQPNTRSVSPKEATIDLNSRTYESLDYEIILSTLQKQCFTKPAFDFIQYEIDSFTATASASTTSSTNKEKTTLKPRLSSNDYDSVIQQYKALQEMEYTIEEVYSRKKPHPIRTFQQTALDVSEIQSKLNKNSVLTGAEIMEVLTVFTIYNEWYDWFDDLSSSNAEDLQMEIKEIPKMLNSVQVNQTFVDFLSNAFEPPTKNMPHELQSLKLSSNTFPEIRHLRTSIQQSKRDILKNLNTLISNPNIQSKLALESGTNTYAEMNGRIVLPLDIKYKNLGIVHDISRSGKTAYVEPTEFILPTNELRQLESQLESIENKIWRLITTEISLHWNDIQDLLNDVLGQLDILVAKKSLGKLLNGCIPIVKKEGVIDVKDAIHPILQLRHNYNTITSSTSSTSTLVKNDIQLGIKGNQGLILSGPNSGGKTIILKTLGLMAYLVSCSIPIPALKQSRVDFFPTIIADIGDVQSVQGDLSTFSGHLVTYREMFNTNKYTLNQQALIIMDEVGSGTDPSQGVALAQSILESLVSKGCKVAITTHFQSLKQLPSCDPRFIIAGMQFINNQPTYKLLFNEIGESFALQIAQRYDVPTDILDRAYELLDSDTKTRLEYLETLQQQKVDYEQRLLQLQQQQDKIDQLKAEISEQKEQFELDYNALQSKKLQSFVQSLQDKEQKLSSVLTKIQKDPSKEVIMQSWDEIKILKKDIITDTLQKEQQQSSSQIDSITSYIPISDLNPKPDLKQGDVVYVYKPNTSFHNKPAKIHSISSNGKVMEVFIDGSPMHVRIKTSELMLPSNTDHLPKIREKKKTNFNKKLSSKIGKRALAELELQPTSINTQSNSKYKSSILDQSNPSYKTKNVAIRTNSNTIDVRGQNFSEAQRSIESFFSSSMSNRRLVVYILHGQGASGILKDKIRNWCKGKNNVWVQKWKIADQSDGGDAFTFVELKSKVF